jgi:hypothetical protein
MKNILLLGLVLPVLSYANHCQELDMAITNNTGHTCQLVETKLVHGRLSENTQFSKTIAVNTESQSVIIKQSKLSGPEVVLRYSCGGKSITIESGQALCLMVDAPVHAEIMAADSMGGQYTTQKGSFIWSKHGEVRWRLH